MKSTLVICLFLVIGAVQAARLRRQAVTEAALPGTTSKTDGLNVALGFLVDELDKEAALGGPVNPAGLQKASILMFKVNLLGGTVDKDTKAKYDDLVASAADNDVSMFAASAAKPQDTKVNVPQPGV